MRRHVMDLEPRAPADTAPKATEGDIECRPDVRTIFEAAARAGALSLTEPWMYMYSIGSAHYFKHQVTRQYRVWRGEVPLPPGGPPPTSRADAGDER